eukprot:TRINITY_DN6018_c0_g1_i1.p1 TRINITY_DN6018_c0_g1~~TRINITY_DN6018_c0_g1_i1.p1  ORF type:complete len:237 (+),score=15.07 TRINITY_DN6018_c0_g1_i1:49-711(+)
MITALLLVTVAATPPPQHVMWVGDVSDGGTTVRPFSATVTGDLRVQVQLKLSGSAECVNASNFIHVAVSLGEETNKLELQSVDAAVAQYGPQLYLNVTRGSPSSVSVSNTNPDCSFVYTAVAALEGVPLTPAPATPMPDTTPTPFGPQSDGPDLLGLWSTLAVLVGCFGGAAACWYLGKRTARAESSPLLVVNNDVAEGTRERTATLMGEIAQEDTTLAE